MLAHEIGHHVQKITGIERQVRELQRARSAVAEPAPGPHGAAGRLLRRPVGFSTAQRDILEAGDIEEGLNAAAAIGDDRIQRMSAGSVNPDAFTHGSSAQRVEWFRRGLSSGDFEACDTFGAAGL